MRTWIAALAVLLLASTATAYDKKSKVKSVRDAAGWIICNNESVAGLCEDGLGEDNVVDAEDYKHWQFMLIGSGSCTIRSIPKGEMAAAAAAADVSVYGTPVGDGPLTTTDRVQILNMTTGGWAVDCTTPANAYVYIDGSR